MPPISRNPRCKRCSGTVAPRQRRSSGLTSSTTSPAHRASAAWSSSAGTHRRGRADADLLDRAAALLRTEGGRLLDQARRVERLSRDAETDPLTGLANSRRLRRLMDDLAPGGALAVIDLDQFKVCQRPVRALDWGPVPARLRRLPSADLRSRRDRRPAGRRGVRRRLPVRRCCRWLAGDATAARRVAGKAAADHLLCWSRGDVRDGATGHVLHRADEALYEAKALRP